jgi:hypothetical protein
MPASAPPPSVPTDENGSFVLRFGMLVGLATAASLVCTLPAMTRVSLGLSGQAPTLRAWAALAAAALGPMGFALVVLRGARQGMRTFVEPRTRLRAFGLGLWLAMLFVTLALLGGFLRATTHHRALAGVTYAFGALGLAAGWGLVCARAVTILRNRSETTQRVVMALLGGVAVIAIGYLGLRFVSAVSNDPSASAAAATVLDVSAFVLTSFLASLDWRALRRPLAMVGPPVAVFVAALGITTLRDMPVRQAIGEHAPTYSTAVSLFPHR